MKILKRFKGLIAFFLVMALLFGALVVGKNIFLRQARAKLDTIITYAHLRLSYFPPALVMEDVRAVASSPFFTARTVTVRISYMSLLRKEKPLTVVIEGPVLQISEGASRTKRKSRPFWPFPFLIEKGLALDGEILYRRMEGSLHSRKLKVLFAQEGDSFSFQAEAGEYTFTPAASKVPFGGRASLSVFGQGREISIRGLVVEGTGFVIKAVGTLRNQARPVLELDTIFNVETGHIARLLNIPFDWEGRAEGRGRLETKGGELFFNADLSSRAVTMNLVPLGEVTGRVAVRGKAGGEVEFNLQKRYAPTESVLIRFGGGRVDGQVRGVLIDPILSYYKVPWPVRSPIWGNFVFENKRLTSDGEFRDELETPEPPRYPFRGKVRFEMDLQAKDLTFSSADLDSSFGRVEVRGGVRVGRDMDLAIRGEIKDVKQARAFTSFILNRTFEFPEIRGRGTADIKIAGDYDQPRVTAVFSCAPAGFAKYDAASVEGTIDILRGNVLGTFRTNDANMKGEIDLAVEGNRVEAGFRLADGAVEMILPPLDVLLPLTGRAKGVFKLVQDAGGLQLKGDFSSPELRILGQPATNVRGGLAWKDGTLDLSGLGFMFFNGTVGGDFSLKPVGGDFDIDLAGKGMDLAAVQSGLNGKLNFGLGGKGVFGKDRPSGKFEVLDLLYPPFQKTEARGDCALGYLEDRIDLDIRGSFLPGSNDFQMLFKLPLHQDSILGDIKGGINNLDLLLPWKGAKGHLNYLGEVQGLRTAPRISGAVDLQGSLLPLPGFAHALNDFTGLAFIQDGKISVRSFQGKLGDGDVRGGGEVGIGGKGVEFIDVRMDGKNMALSPLERTRALTDGWVRLTKDSRSFVLDGELSFSRISWRREIYEKFGFSSTPVYQSRREKGFFDDLSLNLRLRAGENAWMENSLGRISGRLDLTISGNINSPLILGDIEALGGEVYFQDRKFKVVRGRLSFFNPASVEPYLDFRGETYVKDYRVTFSLNGLVNNLRPEFGSSPPLPPEDVLALLALGEAFRRSYSYDTSTRLSTASLLSFQIAEQAQKRAEGLFSLARFRVDPFVLGSSAEMTARLTVGRQISRNLSILYSTNLTTQREEIVRMEWDLSQDFSLVGMRNELGRISFDVKIRKRF
jgi:hypothetical protein